jgi:hypothetical protein
MFQILEKMSHLVIDHLLLRRKLDFVGLHRLLRQADQDLPRGEALLLLKPVGGRLN